jgi:hypothetical protein
VIHFPLAPIDTFEMSPISARRSSRLHMSTSVTLNLRHTDPEQSRFTRRTTPTIGTPPTIPNRTQNVRSYTSSTFPHRHITSPSQNLNNTNTNTRTSKRARPRWYRPPPPEAYLIIRAHRRPIGGWGEDWSKKGDGWCVPLFPSHLTILLRLGIDMQDIQFICHI